ncbi:hypothetical protein [Marinomonas sp. PE14-40]|uniref:hypothetical protein n=1 Tax=Marinomonas sp. PE14-40 TaxID=3060621 RepID=UPI003F6809F5
MFTHSKTMIAIAMFSTLQGCATLTTESTQDVLFTSKPEGASLYNYNGKKLLCTMPCTLTLNRSPGAFFIARLEGYKVQALKLKFSKNTKSDGNVALLTAYSVGNLVDGLSGAKYQFQSTKEVIMEKEEMEKPLTN